jgi:predicted DNA-binding transcriptional regulator AlpA
MTAISRNSKLAQRGTATAPLAGGTAEPVQLPLQFSAAKRSSGTEGAKLTVPKPNRASDIRIASLDRRLTTREVVLVVGVNRSTIFRWTRSGRFPPKHKSGGWLQSDVERWLSEHARTTGIPTDLNTQ